MKRLFPLLALIPLLARAEDPKGFVIWKGGELKGFEKKLAPRMNEQKVATEQLVNFGNHSTMVAHREADGEAEVHEKMADLFVIESGEATLLIGGTVNKPRTSAPGEIRGPSVTGGEKKTVSAGDVVHIPARVPHQMFVQKGKQVTYFVMKVEEK